MLVRSLIVIYLKLEATNKLIILRLIVMQWTNTSRQRRKTKWKVSNLGLTSVVASNKSIQMRPCCKWCPKVACFLSGTREMQSYKRVVSIIHLMLQPMLNRVHSLTVSAFRLFIFHSSSLLIHIIVVCIIWLRWDGNRIVKSTVSRGTKEIMNLTASMCIASTGRRWPDLLRELSYAIITHLTTISHIYLIFSIPVLKSKLLVVFMSGVRIFVSILIVILISLN